MHKPFRTLGSGLPIEERLRQAECDRDMWRGLHSDLEDQANQVAIENARLREIARQMFSCISLRDMWTGNIDGDPIEVYNAWLAEFGNDSQEPGA